MIEHRPGLAKAGAPWALLGMLVLVAACEALVVRHRHVFMTPHEFDWMSSGRNAAKAAPVRRAEVLFFGDSMLKFGLSPRVFEDLLGRSTYSLALLDGKPAASYFLLRRAFEAGARPRILLVDFQPECMYQPWETDAKDSALDSLNENRHWKSLLSVRECLDLSITCRDPEFFARTLIGRLLPTMRSRDLMVVAIRLALEGKPNRQAWKNAKFKRNRTLNQGGLVLAREPSYDGGIENLKKEVMFSRTWFHRPEETVYVRRFLRLAAEHRVPVIWILPPNTPRIQETRDQIGLNSRYDGFIERLQRHYPDLFVVDARRSGYGHSLFVDAVHLDRQGATVLSQDVAELLRPIIEGAMPTSRWSVVPTYREPARMIALEDVDQSGARLSR